MARTAAAIFVAGSLVCLLQGCGSPSTATVECNDTYGLKKGCSVTVTCTNPVATVKASSECPKLEDCLKWDETACKAVVQHKDGISTSTFDMAVDFWCNTMKRENMNNSPHESVLTDEMSDNMDESASGTLEEKALYMLLGGFIVVALYLAVRGVLACRGTQEARIVKTAMEQTEMPQLSVAA